MTLVQIGALHQQVARAADALHQRHADQLQCRCGCNDCCSDDLTVFEVEAELIRAHYPQVLASEPHAVGKCAFLDPLGACRIYDHRPYVCRTQGLPLRWIDDDGDEPAELRDICPLNEVDLLALDEDECWTLGPTEAELQQLQMRSHGALRRVLLRSLFAPGPAPGS